MLKGLELYFISVTIISAFVIFWGLFRLKKTEQQRLKSAKEMEVSEAVDSHMADDDYEAIMRRRAVLSIEARFSFIRRAFVPTVLGIALFLVVVPLLPTLSASYISLFAGAIAVLVGLASKPLLENAVSGIVITLSQPIHVNDTVIIDGMYGTIEKINLLYTVVKVWNWRRYNIPNHRFLQKEFENLTQNDETEWVHIEFFVSPEADLEEVKELAKDAIRTKYLSNSEPPSFWVMGLEKDAIKCWVAGWAENPAMAWALKSSARKQLATSLQKRGIYFQTSNNRVIGPNSNSSSFIPTDTNPC